jgi:hypothetical protein
MRTIGWLASIAVVVVAACKGEGGGGERPPVDTPALVRDAGVTPAEPARVPIGLAAPRDFNYLYGKGEKSFATIAAKKVTDLEAIAAIARETLEADPGHLDAHFALARASLARPDHAEAIGHLRPALAGDLGEFLPRLDKEPGLAALKAAPEGAELEAFIAEQRAALVRLAREGVLIAARRSTYKPPKGGKGRASTRAEVLAYDPTTERFARLTHTGWQVAGFVRAPSGDELTYVTYGEVGADAGGAPLLGKIKIGVRGLADPAAPALEVALPGTARTVVVAYGPGDQLFATLHGAAGALGEGPGKTFAIDRARKKPRAAKAPAEPAARLVVRHDGVELAGAPSPAVAADWAGEPPAAEEFVVAASSRRVAVPAGKAAARDRFAASSTARLAFATVADPCAPAGERAASLFVVDGETGKLKHVTDASSPLHPSFVGPDVLAYDDGEGQVRLFDAAASRELVALGGKLGAGLAGVATRFAAPCRREVAGGPGPEEGAPALDDDAIGDGGD